MMTRSETPDGPSGKLKLSLRVVVGLVLLGGLAVWAMQRSAAAPAIVQPIAFDHHRHVSGKDGIRCVTCHSSADNQIFAGVPQVDNCMNCHAIVTRMSPKKLERKPELAKLKQFAAAGLIPWQRVYREPDYVFFSHRRHVAVAKIECAACHGNMSDLSTPPIRPVINQSMGWCISCHVQRQASRDCISCHK